MPLEPTEWLLASDDYRLEAKVKSGIERNICSKLFIQIVTRIWNKRLTLWLDYIMRLSSIAFNTEFVIQCQDPKPERVMTVNFPMVLSTWASYAERDWSSVLLRDQWAKRLSAHEGTSNWNVWGDDGRFSLICGADDVNPQSHIHKSRWELKKSPAFACSTVLYTNSIRYSRVSQEAV